MKPGINVRANVTSITEKSGTLLPVISAGIEGRDGLYKHRKILLDSGGGRQISFIHIETAENLRLEGKSVSITITKVGGEDEERPTKVYKVQDTSLKNRRTFPVKAFGIPCISDDTMESTRTISRSVKSKEG